MLEYCFLHDPPVCAYVYIVLQSEDAGFPYYSFNLHSSVVLQSVNIFYSFVGLWPSFCCSNNAISSPHSITSTYDILPSMFIKYPALNFWDVHLKMYSKVHIDTFIMQV